MNPAAETYLWTASSAMVATGGNAATAGGDWHADGVSIDSRTIKPGDLFVAIRGPKFDGHDFAADALATGAAAVVVDRRPDALPADAPLLEVKDTTLALEDLGIAARERVTARVIAVTGSVGKTGTKEVLRFVLEEQGPSVASQGSLNNHWGVPLSLSRMPADTAFGIFEIGMNHPGEIAPLARMVRPHVAIITNVEAVHSAYFDSIETIADAKAEIFQGLAADGVAVINRDNAQFARLSAAAEVAGVANIIGFGVHEDAHVRAVGIRSDCEGSDVEAMICGAEVAYRLGVPGRHWAINSLAVLAAVHAAGGDVKASAAELAGMCGMKGRGRRHTIAMNGGSFVVIDDSYNASPVSMAAALETLGQMQPAGNGRRIAVLGDMLELGDESEDQHAALAEILIAEKIDLVFTGGQYMSAIWEGLPREMRGGNASSAAGILNKVMGMIRPGDVVIVKGSAGSNTGPIVEALLELGDSQGSDPDDHKLVVNGSC
jgi:UDP-N-acetylmuramoyl-tripeptide--D-alanyl-D-alanine ligase